MAKSLADGPIFWLDGPKNRPVCVWTFVDDREKARNIKRLHFGMLLAIHLEAEAAHRSTGIHMPRGKKGGRSK
ncbi:hypothetical protein [Brevibacillus gelatini]|uniref:Uncharacterized protein n=1 Tax=Brevibacillus gelatini TaxID=1655277 RepID=A0A3M8BE20_9BACL|nr:hypothetical protein [Brevibacillus gelatini]RNB61135.1 hypothetical protein EDM57_01875 [Brevibacillus gelatini]